MLSQFMKPFSHTDSDYLIFSLKNESNPLDQTEERHAKRVSENNCSLSFGAVSITLVFPRYFLNILQMNTLEATTYVCS